MYTLKSIYSLPSNVREIYFRRMRVLLVCVASVQADIQVVVSRFNEDLDWLHDPAFNSSRHLIYNKGPRHVQCTSSLDCSVVTIPNVGRESHTYLYHIIENYDNLANVTVFLPGSAPNDHTNKKWSRTMQLMKELNESPVSNFPIKRPTIYLQNEIANFTVSIYQSTDKSNRELNPETAILQCPERPLSAWVAKNFPDYPPIPVCQGNGIFAVSREHITQHPIEHYQRLIGYVNTSSSPEAGHFFEFSWVAVFYPVPDSHLQYGMASASYHNSGWVLGLLVLLL